VYFSIRYQQLIQLTSGAVNGTYEVVSYIADFFQGTVSFVTIQVYLINESCNFAYFMLNR